MVWSPQGPKDDHFGPKYRVQLYLACLQLFRKLARLLAFISIASKVMLRNNTMQAIPLANTCNNSGETEKYFFSTKYILTFIKYIQLCLIQLSLVMDTKPIVLSLFFGTNLIAQIFDVLGGTVLVMDWNWSRCCAPIWERKIFGTSVFYSNLGVPIF